MMKRHEIVEKRNSQAAIGLSSHCTGDDADHIKAKTRNRINQQTAVRNNIDEILTN
jgi:hypothetical protein